MKKIMSLKEFAEDVCKYVKKALPDASISLLDTAQKICYNQMGK